MDFLSEFTSIMNAPVAFLVNNREWLFSGLGLFLLPLLWRSPKYLRAATKNQSNKTPYSDYNPPDESAHYLLAFANVVWNNWIDRSISSTEHSTLPVQYVIDNHYIKKGQWEDLELVDQRQAPIPLNSVTDDAVFDQLGPSVLIIASPGQGKTTLLLEITRKLISRAKICLKEQQPSPIPVIFLLASWDAKGKSFKQWLIDETTRRYKVQADLSQYWLEKGMIIPMLDGLDEVDEKFRAILIDKINSYRKEHGLNALFMTSRLDEYQSCGVLLEFDTCLVIKDRNPDIVRSALENDAERDFFDAFIVSDQAFQKISGSALVYSLIRRIFDNATEISAPRPSEGFHENFIDYFIKSCLSRKKKTKSGLTHVDAQMSSLAALMNSTNQSLFYAEDLQYYPEESINRVWFTRVLPRITVGVLLSFLYSTAATIFVGLIIADILNRNSLGSNDPIIINYSMLAFVWIGLFSIFMSNCFEVKETRLIEATRSFVEALKYSKLAIFLIRLLANIVLWYALLNGIFGLEIDALAFVGISIIVGGFDSYRYVLGWSRRKILPELKSVTDVQNVVGINERRERVNTGLRVVASVLITLGTGSLLFAINGANEELLWYGIFMIAFFLILISYKELGDKKRTFISMEGSHGQEIMFMESLSWSGKAVLREMSKIAIWAALNGILGSVVILIILFFFLQFGRITGTYDFPIEIIFIVWGIGTAAGVVAIVFSPILGIVQAGHGYGFISKPIEDRRRSGEGINRSLRRGGIIFIVSFSPFILLTGAMVFFSSRAAVEAQIWWMLLSFDLAGLVVSLNLSLRWGLYPAIQHYWVRYIMARQGKLPYRLGSFLELMKEIGLMKRVGGGYLFIHPLIQARAAEIHLKGE